jgi:peptidoglycan hydrolase-like amidase
MKAAAFVLLAALRLSAESIDVGVFTLFRPTELHVASVGAPLVLTDGAITVTLEGRQSAEIRLSNNHSTIHVAARDGSGADFLLSIPGKIQRRFHGNLTIEPREYSLHATVSMDLENAVASVVAAESRPGTPLEGLKAQAVAARSYYLASPPRHDHFEFCDTTHCQFLREIPLPNSPAMRAAIETRGLVLSYRGKVFPALYSASCGGETRALDDAAASYPYFAVRCDYCRRHRRGVVEGHQLGLCQRGAAAMAAAGASWREILEHYYPGSAVAPTNSEKFDGLH